MTAKVYNIILASLLHKKFLFELSLTEYNHVFILELITSKQFLTTAVKKIRR